MIAVLPAAGKGTRMAEVTSRAKELLLLGGLTVLERAALEARDAGISQIVVVGSSEKRDLAAHAAEHAEWELREQMAAAGLGPAIASAGRLDAALVLLPDTVFHPSSPVARLVGAINRGYDLAIAVERVAEHEMSSYGIVEWSQESGRISAILEKPQPRETPSRWAIAARYGLSPRTMMLVRGLSEEAMGKHGEQGLTPMLNEAIRMGYAALAVPLEPGENRLDCGSPEGYRLAREVFDAGR